MERNEAIEVVRKNWPEGRHQLSEALKTLIPELKESEDERIKKALMWCVETIEGELGCYDAEGIAVAELKSWLEKQGEPKPVCKMQVSDELYEHIRNTCACIDDALSSKSFADINDYLSMAEHSAQSAFDMIEKQGEQNPADKDEPKFKVGDWVTNGIDVDKIIGIDLEDENYLFENGGKSDISLVESISHIWTIKDAKDGDVLYENSTKSILMFKSQTCGWVKVYCDYWIAKDKFTGTDHADYGRLSEMELTPATKEQRDLLFQKMKEAGYEWDAEKKELKKIEQKPAWSERDEKMIEFWNLYYEHKVGDMPNKDVVENLEKFRDWLKAIRERYAWKPSDEQMEALYKYVTDGDKNLTIGESVLIQHFYNDLKKLKE